MGAGGRRRRLGLTIYGDSSLNFKIAYYVEGGDYIKYMDIQQQINLAIMEPFDKKKIEFAYPNPDGDPE